MPHNQTKCLKRIIFGDFFKYVSVHFFYSAGDEIK